MNRQLVESARQRADDICEYCRLPSWLHAGRYEVEHVIAKQHLGSDALSNLAFACFHCNKAKGPNIAGLDRARARARPRLVPLFNPRTHKWAYHFRWDGPILAGKSAIGRATVQVLDMNAEFRLELRATLIALGEFPPDVESGMNS